MTVVEFYGSYHEDDRLGECSLELIRTKEIISRYLTPGMRIADVGGATGVYSFWLASLGYEVHLADLTPHHIEQARAKAQNTGLSLASYQCCDARRLPYADRSFDVVLEMGPLYHLQDRQDRIEVLIETKRVLKPDSVIMCTVISRYASLIDGLKYTLVKDPRFQAIVDQDLENGRHDNPDKIEHYFTTAYFHTPDEIRSELEEVGFVDVSILAVEGIGHLLPDENQLVDPQIGPHVLDYLRRVESTHELLGASYHLLAIARIPSTEG